MALKTADSWKDTHIWSWEVIQLMRDIGFIEEKIFLKRDISSTMVQICKKLWLRLVPFFNFFELKFYASGWAGIWWIVSVGFDLATKHTNLALTFYSLSVISVTWDEFNS